MSILQDVNALDIFSPDKGSYFQKIIFLKNPQQKNNTWKSGQKFVVKFIFFKNTLNPFKPKKYCNPIFIQKKSIKEIRIFRILRKRRSEFWSKFIHNFHQIRLRYLAYIGVQVREISTQDIEKIGVRNSRQTIYSKFSENLTQNIQIQLLNLFTIFIKFGSDIWPI